jgi:hypothetical protein
VDYRPPDNASAQSRFFSGHLSPKGVLMPRTELEQSVHRLANRIECEMVLIFRELLAESRIGDVHSVGWNGCRFIEVLRNVRDGKEGGDE